MAVVGRLSRLFCSSGALVAAALVLSLSADARAMGALVSYPPGSAAATEVRLAFAGTGTPAVRWGSLRVQGTPTTFAWILPVRDGAYVDLASDAWLESLEAASAPRVIPPDPTPECGLSAVPETDGDPSHRATVAPEGVEVAADRTSLDASLAAHGLSLTSDLAPGIDAAAAAGLRFVVLVFTGAPDVRTRAVRVVDDSPPGASLSLLRGAPTGTAVTAYATEPGAVRIGYASSLALDPSLLRWGGMGTSTYAAATEALLLGSPGSWLVDTSAHEAAFDSVPVQGGSAVPALDDTYFARAAAYADATDAPAACSSAATAASTADTPVAVACPAGAAARVDVTTACAEAVQAGEVDPSVFRCGGISDDLALALSGMAPEQAWIMRARTVLSADVPGDDAPTSPDTGGGTLGPVLSATGYETTCSPPVTGGGSSGAPSGSSGDNSSDPNSGSSPNDVGNAAAGAAAVSSGCGGDTSSDDSSSGSCGGDTSQTSDGSDSSSSSSCGGDTSSSSSSSSDSCSGDTSSSSSSSDCSTASRTPRSRTPASRALVFLVAALAMVRRARTRRHA
jgi:hypothetical protein